MNSEHPLLNISAWKLIEKVNKSKLREKLLKKSKRTFSSSWLNDGSIVTLDLYCYLKARFGQPNGLILKLLKGFDSFIYWHYVIFIENYSIHFLDTIRGLEILIQGVKPFSRDDWNFLIIKLKEDFKRFGPKKSKISNSFEKRYIFINPHKRLKNVIKKLMSRLDSLDIVKPSIEESSPDELNRWIHNIGEAMILGTSLKAIIPVWGESFINLVFYLLRKRKVIDDKRICDFFVQQPIDVRIKTLHLYCNGFKDSIDFSRDEFKKFKKLMDFRNDYLHGNIKPEQLKVEKIMYDGNIPIFSDERGFVIRLFENSMHQIKKEEVSNDFDITYNFIIFVLDHLEEHYKEEVTLSLDNLHLSFEGREAFPLVLSALEYFYF